MNDAVTYPDALPADVALDLIDFDPANVRRTQPTPLEQALFEAHLQERGLIQRVLLRPWRNGERYLVVAGERRVRAAIKLGWASIPADVRQLTDDQALALMAAENCQRVDLDALDKWQAMVRMQEAGLTLRACAQALNITDARARQLDRLGRIAPALLDAMREIGIPEDYHLADIAQAALADQERVFKKHAKRTGGKNAHLDVPWHRIGADLRGTVFSQEHAIFDTSAATGIAWQEDVFAEPGDKAAFTTTDKKRFLQLQSEALAAQVGARKKKKEAVELVAWNDKEHGPTISAGYKIEYGGKLKSMKLPAGDPRLLLLAINLATGAVAEQMAISTAKPAKPTAKPAPAAASAPSDTQAEDDEDSAAGDTEPAAAPEPARSMTAAGRAMVATLQTEALRRAVKDGFHPTIDVLHMLMLAVLADNVTVGSAEFHAGVKASLRRKLLTSEGLMRPMEQAELLELARELIGRMLVVTNPLVGGGSGLVALAIGEFTDANDTLPPFDTPEFLKTLSLPALRQAADAAEITGAKTATALRDRLAGKIGTSWHPKEAEFVPQPLPKPGWNETDADDAGDSDAGEE